MNGQLKENRFFLWLHGILWNSNATLRRIILWDIGFKFYNVSQKYVDICCVTHSQKMAQEGFVVMVFVLLVYNTSQKMGSYGLVRCNVIISPWEM